MLLPQDITPDKSLYVIGGRIIHTFNMYKRSIIDPKDLYDLYIKHHGSNDLSFNYFMYGLDWLYIIGYIETYNNKIKRCF